MAYMLRDGDGLWLVVEPTGRKWWKLRVVFAKKENSFSLGDYPEVSLAQAREKRITTGNRLLPASIRVLRERRRKFSRAVTPLSRWLQGNGMSASLRPSRQSFDGKMYEQ